MYDDKHRLTRAGMEAVIASGGSVLHKGKIISTVANLPSESELATTKEEKAKVSESIDEQIARLQAEKAKLETAADGLEKLSKEELVALADKESVAVEPTATKPVIIAAIRAKRAAA